MKAKKRYKYSCHFCGDYMGICITEGANGVMRREMFGRDNVYLCDRCYSDYWNYEINAEARSEPRPDPADMKTTPCTNCSGSGHTTFSANNDYRPNVQIQCWACEGRGFWLTMKTPLELLADCAPKD